MLSHLMRTLRQRFGLRRRGEGGQALLFVLAGLALLGTIPIAIATTTVNQLPETTRNLNFEAAYEAAQAGLNDYIQHLDANEAYGLYCKTGCQGTNGNAAFSGWVQASTSPLEYYTYAPSDTNGQISLEVSGKAGTGPTAVVRTFSYNLVPASSLDDVYWSNYETLDPVLGALPSRPSSGYQYCATRYGEPSSDSYGQPPNNQAVNAGYPSVGPPGNGACEVSFVTGDDLNGPVFSNDTFRVCGSPEFDGSVESGNIYNTNSGNSSIYVASNGCGSATPNFAGGAPTKVGNQTPRTGVDDLIPARNYGCFITGGSGSSLTPVTIGMTLSVSGSTTKITWSGSGTPKVDNASTNPNTSGGKTNCNSPITLSNLTTGLIFVNGNVTISGQMTGAATIVTCNLSSDTQSTCNSAPPDSNIVINGNLTYPTANKVTVSGDPVSDTKDVLGLIAENFVEVTTTSTVEIDAAILALEDSFYVNNWYGGSSYGTLNVFGSIAQNFRGAVGQSNGSGYLKSYNYDNSLQTLFPPYFIPPDGATWSPTAYEECGQGLTHSVQNTPSC